MDAHFYFYCFGIYTVSLPITAGTSTGGGAVLGKPERSRFPKHFVLTLFIFKAPN